MSKYIDRRNFLKSVAPLIVAPAFLSNSKLFAAPNEKSNLINTPLEVLHDGILSAPTWGSLGRPGYACYVRTALGISMAAPTCWTGTLSSPKILRKIELITGANYRPPGVPQVPVDMSGFGSAAFPIYFGIWNDNIQTFCSSPFANGTIGVPNIGSTTIPIYTEIGQSGTVLPHFLIGWDNLNLPLPANVPLEISVQFETFDPSRPGLGVYLSASNVPGPRTNYFSSNTGCGFIGELGMSTRITVSDPVSASNYNISGRVIDSENRGISRAFMTLQNTNTGAIFPVMTNQFGNFKFSRQTAGNSYNLSVRAKGRTFAPNTRTFQLLDNVTDLEFIGNEN